MGSARGLCNLLIIAVQIEPVSLCSLINFQKINILKLNWKEYMADSQNNSAKRRKTVQQNFKQCSAQPIPVQHPPLNVQQCVNQCNIPLPWQLIFIASPRSPLRRVVLFTLFLNPLPSSMHLSRCLQKRSGRSSAAWRGKGIFCHMAKNPTCSREIKNCCLDLQNHKTSRIFYANWPSILDIDTFQGVFI